MSQWVGHSVYVITQYHKGLVMLSLIYEQSCNQQPRSFTQDLGKAGSFTQVLVGMKTCIFYKKLILLTHQR